MYFQNPPAISIGGLASKSLYQFTLQSGDIDALDSAAREARGAAAAAAGARERHERSADRQSAGQRRHRSRQGRPARRVSATRDREHAVRRLRAAAGVDDLHVDERVLGGAGAAAASSSRTSRRSAHCGCAPRAGTVVPLGAVAKSSRHRAADRQSRRAAARGDDLVRSRAGRLARHRADDGGAARPRRCCRPTVAASFRGRAGVHGNAAGAHAAARARRLRHLHRARHAVRELHPPDHDSLGAAVRGVRRARDAA